jgi:hypothetical protein
MESLIRKDGYINLNQLCKSGGKQFRKWKENKRSKIFLTYLSEYTGISTKNLIVYEINSPTDKANWGHPKVATYVAQWISVEFSVKISIWIDDWVKINERNKRTYLKSLTEIKDDNNDNIEKNIQLKLQKMLGGTIEVRTAFGYIDLMTDTHIIEIKQLSRWKHAIGQILSYGISEMCENKQKRIHLFSDSIPEDKIKIIKQVTDKLDIILTYEKIVATPYRYCDSDSDS